MKLHHIGVIVDSIQRSVGELSNFFKYEVISTTFPVDSQKVNVCFLKIGEPFLELIEPAADNSPISEFVKTGGGIHHLCFEVDDIHKEVETMSKKGATILVKPVRGFDERLIAFVDLNTKTKCGLVEFLERR